MKKWKVGIAGVRGLSTMAGFRCDPRVEVTAFCDLNEALLEEKAAEFGIDRVYRVYEDMLDSDLDIIVVATPMQLHMQQAVYALEAGKHVLSEVTAGVTMDELWWLKETVEKTGLTYMMAENYLYTPEVQLVGNMVSQGLFGELYFGEGEYLHNLDSMIRAASPRNPWRRYWQLGKRGLFYPTHSLGPVMKWFGDDRIVSVACFGTGSHTSPEFRQDDTSITVCTTEKGRLVKIRLDCLSHRPHNLAYYSLQGTKGCYESPRGLGDDHKIWLEGPEGYSDEAAFRPLKEYQQYLPERYQNATEEQKAAGHWGGDFFIVKDFIDAVDHKTKPPVDIYDACEWTAAGLLSEESVQAGGKVIDLPNFRAKP